MDFQELPKVELHAHLNGSLSNETLMELHKHKYGNDEITSNNYTIFSNELLSMTHCFEKFKYAHDLTDTKERLRIATKRVIEEFVMENTIYLELRSTPRGNSDMLKSDYITVICEAIVEASNEIPGILVKYIPSIDRAQSVSSNEESLEEILKAKDVYPHIIVGLDLSGNPVMGDFNSLKPILIRARESGLKLTIHCAEVAGQTEEIKDILEFNGVDRIGHGTYLDETPELWSLFQSRGLFVECCLSSNVKCGTVPNYNDHHMRKLIEINNPFAICTDDYGVFETTLSREFEIATQTFKFTRKDMEMILMDSVKFAFCSDSEKLVLCENIRKYFGSIAGQE